jgi:RNA polymerase sigma-70 factor (ECF subfamily)
MTEIRTANVFDPSDTVRIGEDVAALERFYRAHFDELVRYLTGRVPDPHDVADLVADTFLTAVRSAGSYDPRRGRTMPWLVGIARNHLRHFYRQRHHDQQAARKIVGRRLLDADDIADLEERITAQARGSLALDLLAGLPPAQRELVDLVDLGFHPGRGRWGLRASRPGWPGPSAPGAGALRAALPTMSHS